MPNIAASFSLAAPIFSVILAKRVPADRTTGPIANSLTSGVVKLKRELLAGGLLQPVEWLKRTGDKDERGRQTVTKKMITVLIEQQPMLDRGRIDTDRADNTTLTILDQLAILDSDTFRWGDPPHTYRVKSIDGVISNEATGTRFSSSVVVIR